MLRVWNNELNWIVVEYSEFNYLGCTINFRMTLFLFFVFSRGYRSLYRFDFHSKFVFGECAFLVFILFSKEKKL